MDILTLISPYCDVVTNSKISSCSKKIKSSEFYKKYWFDLFKSVATSGVKGNHKMNNCCYWTIFRTFQVFRNLEKQQFFEILKDNTHPNHDQAKKVREMLNCYDKTHYEYTFEFKDEDYKKLYVEHCYANCYKNLKSQELEHKINVITSNQDILLFEQQTLQTQLLTLQNRLLWIEKELKNNLDCLTQYDNKYNQLKQVEKSIIDYMKENNRCCYVGVKGDNKDYFCGKGAKNNFCSRHKK
jgi:hypothetical protein